MAYVKLTSHARKQLRKRRITKAQVERTLIDPDSVTLGERGRLYAKRQTESGRTIVVIFEQIVAGEETEVIVITAWRE